MTTMMMSSYEPVSCNQSVRVRAIFLRIFNIGIAFLFIDCLKLEH